MPPHGQAASTGPETEDAPDAGEQAIMGAQSLGSLDGDRPLEDVEAASGGFGKFRRQIAVCRDQGSESIAR